MKLSIIVPVYNVEEYIVKCIESLLNQNIEDYEIIVVNDGTKDRSIDLIHERFQSDKLLIFEQTNMGLSEARNTGLKKAHGEYVWFFDSDDWMETNSLQNIIESLNGEDILYFQKYYEEKNGHHKIISGPDAVLSGKALSKSKYHHPVQFYIYKSSFLKNNNLTFEKGLIHEDSLFTPIALYKAKRVVAYNKPIYHLLRRESSLSQGKATSKRCMDLIKIKNKLEEFATTYVDKQDRFAWGICIADIASSALFLSTEVDANTKATIMKEIDEDKQLISYLKHSRKIYTKIWGYLVSVSGLRTSSVYYFLYKLRY